LGFLLLALLFFEWRVSGPSVLPPAASLARKGVCSSSSSSSSSGGHGAGSTRRGAAEAVHFSVKDDFGSELLRITLQEDMFQRLLVGHAQRRANRDKAGSGGGGSSSGSGSGVDVEADVSEAADGGPSSDADAFGLKYTFDLRDKAGEAAVNAPEWLVPQGDVLHRLAARHGLTVKKVQNFHEFVYDYLRGKSADTLKREVGDKGILDFRGSVSDAVWRIAGLYAVMVFEKTVPGAGSGSGTGTVTEAPQSPDEPPPDDPAWQSAVSD
jgi:hypothetical protein